MFGPSCTPVESPYTVPYPESHMIYIHQKIPKTAVHEQSPLTVVPDLPPSFPSPLPTRIWNYLVHHVTPQSDLSHNYPPPQITYRPNTQALPPNNNPSLSGGRKLSPTSVPAVWSCLRTPSESTAPISTSFYTPGYSPTWPPTATPLDPLRVCQMGHQIPLSWVLLLIVKSLLPVESCHLLPLVLSGWGPVVPPVFYNYISPPSI